jgi:hypothetical protein
MDERGEVVGFTDEMTGGESWLVCDFAKNDQMGAVVIGFGGKLVVGVGSFRREVIHIKHNDIRAMNAGEGQPLLGRVGFDRAEAATRERGAEHFAIIRGRIDNEDAGDGHEEARRTERRTGSGTILSIGCRVKEENGLGGF